MNGLALITDMEYIKVGNKGFTPQGVKLLLTRGLLTRGLSPCAAQTVSNPSYDVFGNVTANDRPGMAADMAYDYDKLHGWLKGISSPCGFSEQLQRETAANAQFSGNIGSMQWRNTSNGEQHNYDYTYDGLGRLTDALYSSSGNGTEGRYDESVSYNSNGSITTLQRNGMRNDGTFGAIDDLSIDYDGNRLLKVTDDAEALNYNGALDFNDGDDTDCEYRYDSNGALTYDGNRGISSISYDYGHHPRSIFLGTKKHITNDYTPDGQKLSSQHVAYVPKGNGANRRILIIDLYIDGLILRKGKPLMWQFDGGYVDLDDNGSPTGWNYYVTDHLGSTRMVVGSDNTVKETINYYPFGSEMRMQDPAQMTGDFQHSYRFTGKELDRLNGLNMYDFGARWYDVAGVPMWTSVDPLAEKYYHVSPYAYCNNNPVMFVDPDGRFPSMWKAMLNHKLSEMEAKFTGSVVGDIVHDRNARTKNGRYYYNKISSDGEGGFVVTRVTKMSREFADNVSTIGTAIEGVGLGMTLSVVGAEAGVPTAEVGAVVSTAGALTGIAIDIFNGDIGEAAKSALFHGAGWKLKTLIKKIPECDYITKNILQQGTDLKMSLMEYTFDEAIEKKQEEQRRKEDEKN